MNNTTYMIINEDNTIIARSINRDTVLDLLGFLLRYNTGIHSWTIAVDFCEEDAGRRSPSDIP